MRLMTLILLATVALISGCGSEPERAGSAPAPPVLTAKPDPGVAYVAIIGDSYTSGLPSGGNDPDAWPNLVTEALQKEGLRIKPTVGARNGSGYRAYSGTLAFTDQVQQIVGKNDNLVVLFGGARDQAAFPNKADRMTQAVQQTFAKAKKAAPDANSW